jgi:hypothetical protein
MPFYILIAFANTTRDAIFEAAIIAMGAAMLRMVPAHIRGSR